MEQGIKKSIIDWTDCLAISVVVVILLFTFVFRTVGIDGISMENTFYHGDRVIIRSIGYTPKIGDVVVISRNLSNLEENESRSNAPIIKRVVATEKMWVDIRLENINGEEKGVVYTGTSQANLTPLNDGFPLITKDKYESMTTSFPLQVNEGHVFVLGDNRNHSADSRYAEMGNNGQIDVRYILGKATLRIFPFESFGFIE